MTRLQDKTLLITGGTSGIGRDAVLRCLQEGARVIFTGRDVERAQQTIAAAGALGANAEFIVQDVTSEQDWSTVCESIENKYGHLDGLVNNAGVFAHSAIEDTSLDDFKWMWRINVDGIFLGIKHTTPLLQRATAQATIVNVCSLSGLMGHPDCVSYCTSKAAAIMLSKVAAVELAPKVRVNALAPGPVWNELLEKAHAAEDAEAMKEYYRTSQPLKRLGKSADVSDGIVYLASDEARYVNGAVLRIDAGRGAD
jgi:NAD(P)-dependent dehydrogenase (short-subunit alcohol dehydrogenase family)